MMILEKGRLIDTTNLDKFTKGGTNPNSDKRKKAKKKRVVKKKKKKAARKKKRR